MKKITIITSLLIIVEFAFSQTLKFNVGTNIGKIDWKIPAYLANESVYDNREFSPNLSIGFDYVKYKNMNLTSSLGYSNISGSFDGVLLDNQGIDSERFKTLAKVSYVHFNSGIDYNLPPNKTIFPYLSLKVFGSYLISKNHSFDIIENLTDINKLAFGIEAGIGVKYIANKSLISLSGNIIQQFNKIAKWEDGQNANGNIDFNVYNLNLSYGYILN